MEAKGTLDWGCPILLLTLTLHQYPSTLFCFPKLQFQLGETEISAVAEMAQPLMMDKPGFNVS
jgi:hypothetical protein